MTLYLYNTLTSQKDEFVSLQPDQVRMYVCGPTVYDFDHVGHARTYLSFDLLHRLLRDQGYTVTYVQNITDVGHLVNDAESGADKIKQKAQETGQTASQVINQYSEAHKRDMEALQVLSPTVYPKASEHVEEIINFVQGLLEKGFAYATEAGNVYFRVSKRPDYGKLSHRGLAEIITGTRVEPARDKLSPADFALWKAAPLGAKEMVWPSPWGLGFPGWHIECSAMSRKYLGDTFDIHGSAIEHIFPHHENEIAQTESLTDQPMARYWIHSGMLTINGQKMSKSLRNTVTVQDALQEYTANELRLAYYQTHYRRPFDYTKANLEQGVALRRKIFTAYSHLPAQSDAKVIEDIVQALTDDLDSPRALQLWAEAVDKLTKPETDRLMAIFGLRYQTIESNEKAHKLAQEREEARARRDFLTADNRKAEIQQLGFEVVDGESTTSYIPR